MLAGPGPGLLETTNDLVVEVIVQDAEPFETLTQLLATSAPEAMEATLDLERGDLATTLGLSDEANASYERTAQIDPMHQSRSRDRERTRAKNRRASSTRTARGYGPVGIRRKG